MNKCILLKCKCGKQFMLRWYANTRMHVDKRVAKRNILCWFKEILELCPLTYGQFDQGGSRARSVRGGDSPNENVLGEGGGSEGLNIRTLFEKFKLAIIVFPLLILWVIFSVVVIWDNTCYTNFPVSKCREGRIVLFRSKLIVPLMFLNPIFTLNPKFKILVARNVNWLGY